MSTTPSQAHSSQQGPGRNPRGRGQGNRRPNRPVLPLTQPIPGYAGLRYDTQLLSPASAGRAAEGIEAGFILHKLRRIADGQDRYMAFQLYTPVAVRVYDPDVQRRQQDRVTCNCLDYQSTQSACAHLYWLFTRLNGVLGEDRQENQQDSTQIEVISGLCALYPLIEQRRDSLPRDVNDELEVESDESSIEDTMHDHTSHNEPADAYEPSSSSA